MKFLPLLKSKLLGNRGPSFYTDNRAELDKTNYGLLKTACLFSTGMCLFLCVLTRMVALISELSLFYAGFTLLFALLTAAVLTLAHRVRRLISLLYCIFAAAIFMLAILVGTRYSTDIPAVTFCVFLLIIPVLFVTRPIYSVLLSAAACAAFCAATLWFKGAGTYLAQTDVLNAVCCCIVGIGFDITIVNLHLDNIQSKSYFRRQSAIDDLTALPNRRSLDLYLAKHFRAQASRHNDLFVLMMDIDDFKAYNDTYGHVQGDDCLRRVSRALERTARENGLFLARFGGEEFIAVADAHHGEAVAKIAGRFVLCVEKLYLPHSCSAIGRVTISVGYAGLRDSAAANPRALLDCADAALYAAKARGKNCALPWAPTPS